MTRFSKSMFLMGAAVIALSACSGMKGPGEIGKKEDIVVRNNGLPNAQAAAAAPAARVAGQDFSSTVEQGQAVPAPEVANAEPLPNTSPAMEHAVEQQQAANAPVPSTTGATPPDRTTAPVSETRPLDAIAPTQPVNQTVTPPPAETAAAPAAAPVYPQTDYPAAAAPVAAPAVPAASPVPAPAPVAAPAPAPAPAVPTAVYSSSSAAPGPSAVPAGMDYPLDPNAPFSPKAIAAAEGTAVAAPAATSVDGTAPAPVGTGMADPGMIRAAQAALATKGGYTGAQTGEIDANFLNALTKFQGENGLPMGGLNEPTLKALGVIQ